MSTPAHTTPGVQQFLSKNGITPMSHPPYSSDLTPSDLFFVSPDKRSPQREMFANVEKVKQKMAEALKDIKIEKFKNWF